MEDEACGGGGGGATEQASAARLLEQVAAQLQHEVQHAPPGARLSARLRAALERLAPAERARVAARTRDGCAPLFVAARRGNAELVEYLVHVCGAPLEQRGRYPAGGAAHRVTPLWAAAVAGRGAALRALADAGAALDARSDSGSTPLRSACFMTHVDVVRFLCERGADPAAANHEGGTCLINAVQSPRLCRYLLARGAPVDARDAHGATALHYAVREHRADSARVLLAAGADPRARSAAGDDALRAAAARAAAPLVELLLARGDREPRERADALELLGASQLDELDDAAAALATWRRATALRHAGARYLRKRPARRPCAALGGALEWRTQRELDRLAADPDALRAQALLVAVRVLGDHHEDAMFRIMYRGAAYADSQQYRRCAELWLWALEIRLEKDTLLHTDTSHTAYALTRLLLDVAGEPGEAAAGERRPAPDAALRALRLLARHVPESQRLLDVRPRCAAQGEAWDRALRCVPALAALAGAGAAAELAALVRCAPVTLRARESLLHLACSPPPAERSAYFAGEERPPAPARLPCAATARRLLEAGAAAGARDARGRTALHAAARAGHAAAVAALLAGGAHACSPDARGAAPLELPALRALLPAPLACAAARAVLRAAGAPPPLPRALRDFLDLHRFVPDADEAAPARD